ncbi:MAG: L-lactate dehydrogenase complex protein LldE [Sphingobacteriales bacterium]|jgi:L-lactate dehydrogenase complex protein LldE
MDVEIFIPCFIDQIYPETGMNMVKVLEKAGCKVHYNKSQTCCAQPAYNAGFWDEAREVATKFIKDFKGDRPIITPSGSCAGMVKGQYGKLFHNSSLHNQCKNTQERMYELSDFLVNVLEFTDFDATLNAKVAYHDACGALREYGIKQEPRTLLKKVKGLELVDLKYEETCCGFGGTFSVKFNDISTAMAEQKVENALDAGAEYIVSTDASCLMHMYGYVKKNKLPLKFLHIADVLVG